MSAIQQLRPASRPRARGLAALVAAMALALLALATAGPAGAALGNAQNYPAGSSPNDVAFADFDGDGEQDMAVSNGGSDNVSILLGGGDGTFGAATQFPAVSNPLNVSAIATGDFNDDGDADVIVGARPDSLGASFVGLMLGDGDGGLGTLTSYAAGTNVFRIGAGDVDGDGADDALALSYGTNSLSVLTGNLDGTLDPMASYPTGTGPYGLAVGDLDGEGGEDVAVANTTTNNVSVLLSSGATLAPKVDYATGAGSRAVGIGDFDEDGDQDLAVANQTGNNVSVLDNQGDGEFDPPTDFPVLSGATRIGVGDLNGDGNVDVVTNHPAAQSTSNALTLLYGDGAGGFTRTDARIQNSPAFAGSNPRIDSLALGDVNGDSRLDLAGTQPFTGTVAVLIDQVTPTVTGGVPATAEVGDQVTPSATVAGGNSPGGTIVLRAYFPEDVDCSDEPLYTSSPVTVNGNGTYQGAPQTMFVTGELYWTATYSGDIGNAGVTAGCGAEGLRTVVTKALPSFAGRATAEARVGQPVSNLVTVTGGYDPIGEMTVSLHGPADADCTGEPVFSHTQYLEGEGSYQMPEYTPESAGTYRWKTTFTGDPSNQEVSTDCGAENQVTVVTAIPGPSPSPPPAPPPSCQADPSQSRCEQPKQPARIAIASASPKSKAVKRGKPATFKVTVANRGGQAATGVTVCPKASAGVKKRGFKPGGCVSLGTIEAGAQKTATIRVKTTKKAKGSARVTVQASSGSGGAASASVTVKAKK